VYSFKNYYYKNVWRKPIGAILPPPPRGFDVEDFNLSVYTIIGIPLGKWQVG